MSGDRYTISDQNGIYFCTLTVIDWVDLFSRIEYRDIVVDTFNYCIVNKEMQVYSWVIMTNHVHMISCVSPPFRFSDVLRDFKKHITKTIIKEMQLINESRRTWLLSKFSFEAKRTGRAKNYKIWQDSNYAVLLGESIDILQKMNYIHENPVRAGWVDEEKAYRYSSAKDYANQKGLVTITMI